MLGVSGGCSSSPFKDIASRYIYSIYLEVSEPVSSHPLDVLYLLLICLQLFLLPLSLVTLVESYQLIKGDFPVLVGNVVGNVGKVDEGFDRQLVVVVRRPEGV